MAAQDKSKTRETVVLPIGDLSVTFKRPSPGQLAAIRRAATLFQAQDKATQGQGGLLFLEVLDALVTDQVILNRVYAGLANETIPLEEYANASIDLIKHFVPEARDEAPANGPVSTRRATARSGGRGR